MQISQTRAFAAAASRAVVWGIGVFVVYTMVHFGRQNELAASAQQGLHLALLCAVCYLIGYRAYISEAFWYIISFENGSRWFRGTFATVAVTLAVVVIYHSAFLV